jgi:hypothetical protein
VPFWLQLAVPARRRRDWRSELMPLPADVWESCKRAQAQAQASAQAQQQAQQAQAQQAGAAQQVQGEPGQQQGGVSGDEDGFDDEYCLRLLDQLDQQGQAAAAQQ